MKKLCVLFFVFVIFFSLLGTYNVSAEYAGSGGSFGKPTQETDNEEDTMTEDEASQMIMQILQFVVLGGTPITAYIIYERKLSKSARASKKVMNMLDQKDSIWKYKDILPRFKKIFNAVNDAEIQGNFELANSYAKTEILDKIKMQQIWDEKLQKNCNPTNIRLLDARPVAVFDSHDDECDHIWFYVEWSAFENDGRYNTSKSFNVHKEFWQLMRCQNIWKLSDIIDKNKGDTLIFGEDTQTQNIENK